MTEQLPQIDVDTRVEILAIGGEARAALPRLRSALGEGLDLPDPEDIRTRCRDPQMTDERCVAAWISRQVSRRYRPEDKAELRLAAQELFDALRRSRRQQQLERAQAYLDYVLADDAASGQRVAGPGQVVVSAALLGEVVALLERAEDAGAAMVPAWGKRARPEQEGEQ